MSVNFTTVDTFKYWCNKILPLVYDDSLSYYEQLCKVVAVLNQVVENVNKLPEYIAELVSDERLKDIVATLLVNLEKQIADANEGTSETATSDRVVGELVWLDGKLYRVVKQMDAGDKYVVDSNVKKVTVEELFADVRKYIANDIVEVNEKIASQNVTKGTWFWYKNAFCLAIDDIIQGNGYVEGVNYEVVDLETLYKREASARENADSELLKKISDEIVDREQAVTNEKTERQTADNQLQSNIDTEKTERQTADNQLQSNIDTEKADRQSADNQLQSNIDTEINNRSELISNANGNASITKTLMYGDPSSLNEYFKTVRILDKNGTGYNALVATDKTIYLEHEYANVIEYGADNTGVTDSTQAIQNALRSGKKHVIFPTGTYICNLVKIPSNVHVHGYGAKLIATTANSIFLNDSDGTIGGYDANTNITIEGLDFSAPNPSQCTLIGMGHSSYITIRNCTFHDIKVWHMIEINSCNHSIIENCLFYNYGTSDGGYTEMLQLDYMATEAVFPWFGPYDGTKNNDVKITGCSFIGTESLISGRVPSAIGNHTSGNATITNVNISNCYFQNLGSATKFVVCDRLNVTNCLIENCENGLYATNTTHIIYTGNELSGRSDWEQSEVKRGIFTEGSGCIYITITGNIISFFGSHGVTIQGALVQMTGNTINDNGGNGIYVGWGDFGSIYASNVSFSNNHIDGGFYDLILNLQQGTREADIGDMLVFGNKASTASVAIPNATAIQKSYFVSNFIKRAFDNNITEWVYCAENYLNWLPTDGEIYKAEIQEPYTPASGSWQQLISLTLPAGTYYVRGVWDSNQAGTHQGTSRINGVYPSEAGRLSYYYNIPDGVNIFAYQSAEGIVKLDTTTTITFDTWNLYDTLCVSRYLQAIKIH